MQGNGRAPTAKLPGSTGDGQPGTDLWSIVDPADRAMLQIVAMGFTPSEAREALSRTDNGVHHCVHRAIEHLLSRSTIEWRR